jgi:hypothetical protein
MSRDSGQGLRGGDGTDGADGSDATAATSGSDGQNAPEFVAVISGSPDNLSVNKRVLQGVAMLEVCLLFASSKFNSPVSFQSNFASMERAN